MFWKVLGCRWMLLVVYSMSRDVLLVVLLLTNGGLSISLGLEEIRPTKSADRRKNKKEGKMAFVMKLCQIGYGCGLAHNPTTPAAALPSKQFEFQQQHQQHQQQGWYLDKKFLGFRGCL